MIGNQSGYWGFLTAAPADEVDGGKGGSSAGLWVGIGAVVVIAAVAIPLVLRRRNADDRA